MPPQIVVFGSSGLIGKNLTGKILSQSGHGDLFLPNRDEIHILEEASFWKKMHPDAPTTVFYCHGPTDPALDPSEHRRYHVEYPAKWYERFASERTLRHFVTLGSVQETGSVISANNPYLAAKAEWLQTRSAFGSRSLHFQLHTVYGRPIRARSFLGQMKRAIETRSDFPMSDGFQMREYQNVVDIVDLLARLLEPSWSEEKGNTFAISHGNPISLRKLATGVFESFRVSHLLKVGALPTPKGDGEIPSLGSGVSTISIPYRPTVAEVVALMKEEGVR